MQNQFKFKGLCAIHREPLDLVCQDTECNGQGLICSHCQYQSHPHQVTSLKSLIAQITRDHEAGEVSTIPISQIDQIHQLIIDQLDRVKYKDEHKLLDEMIFRHYEDMCGKILDRQSQAKKLINGEINSMDELNRYITKYDFISKDEDQRFSNFQCFVNRILESYRECLKEFRESIEKQQPYLKLVQLFCIDQSTKKKYFFQSSKMHKDIILTDRIKISVNVGYSYRIALLDPPINKVNKKPTKQSCTFKIGNIAAMIGVGIGYKNKIQACSYTFSPYGNHGCYIIVNSGFTYNDSDKNYNSQLKNWIFGHEDEIKVTINPKQQKIVFDKSNNSTFSYSYQERPEDQLHFAVMICTTNESVEVVNK